MTQSRCRRTGPVREWLIGGPAIHPMEASGWTDDVKRVRCDHRIGYHFADCQKIVGSRGRTPEGKRFALGPLGRRDSWRRCSEPPSDLSCGASVSPDGRSRGALRSSFSDLKTTTLDGSPRPLQYGEPSAWWEGQICGYTPLQGTPTLHRCELKGKASRARLSEHDFGDQERAPRRKRDVLPADVRLTFTSLKRVTRPRRQSPVYTFLGRSGNLPAWNFGKYLVDKQGKVVAFFPSDVTPEDPQLRGAIQRSLAIR